MCPLPDLLALCCISKQIVPAGDREGDINEQIQFIMGMDKYLYVRAKEEKFINEQTLKDVLELKMK